MADKKARLTVDGESIDLPVYSPTVGPDVVDVAKLISLGYFTYDPGYVSTVSCESAITYIDGEAGVLRHRGYSIEQLAEQSSFLEVCYLLIYGRLPNDDQFADFQSAIQSEQVIDDYLMSVLSSFPRNAHPMGVMCSLVGAMSAHYHDEIDINDPECRQTTAIRLIAKVPMLAAMTLRHGRNQEFVPPAPNRGYAENFLHMMFSESESDSVSPILANAMDRIFLLHADHEQNASTSTVRLVGSTDANPYACIAAGIAALWGPSHGGANEAVLQMLEEIGDPSKIDAYLKMAKDPNNPIRIMGFGHRVYKNYDPRAKVLQATYREVLGLLGIQSDPTLQMARDLERVALSDDYFIQRRLYPNVDFYSGIILKALGIPTSMFTVIFVVGRTPGWIAQWNEMISKGYKIGRPRQLYTGDVIREYPQD
ncbi:MAG: citrate synthase [Gammaproteobacteria bacterium]|nr:citrate synthase [Gammaproteobacteria bacterium]MYD80042.1 citrate synthase [Gammaproteobacteria bacterium]